jgi:hypothetical protein
LKHAVRSRLGHDPFLEPFRQRIEGFASRQSGKWNADLVVRSHSGERLGNRHLESNAADCHELDQAVVLTVTLIIDPNATLQPESATAAVITPDQPKPSSYPQLAGAATVREVPPLAYSPDAPNATFTVPATGMTTTANGQTAPERTKQPAPQPFMVAAPSTPGPQMRESELASARARDMDSAARLVLAPSLVYNLIPGLAAAFALRDELRLARSLGLDASVLYLPERTQHIGRTIVGYDLVALGLAGCYRPDQTITLLACGGGFAGVTHATVYRGEPDRPGARFWAGARVDVGISATSERLVAEFRAFGVVPITRWHFTSAENGTLFESAILAPGAEIAVGIRLP